MITSQSPASVAHSGSTRLPGIGNVELRLLEPADFRNGFFETLDALRETGLTPEEGCAILFSRPGNIRTFVLLFEGTVAATATLVIEQKFIHRGAMVGHIEDVATHPHYRGKGLATLVVDRLIAEAQHEGCYKVILDCNRETAPFYERLGFRDHAICMRIDL